MLGAKKLIGELLQDLGFVTEQINAHGVHNLWAWQAKTPAKQRVLTLCLPAIPTLYRLARLKTGIHHHLNPRFAMACFMGAVRQT